MRKIFLDGLPRWGKGVNKGKVIWRKSIGHKIKFIYDSTEGEIEILDYRSKDRMLVLKYLDNSLPVSTSGFLKCAIGNLIGKKTSSYLYNEGEIIENVKNGKLKIIKQIKISMGARRNSYKAYEYHCLICKNKDSISEDNLKKNKGCNVCSGRKAMKGHTDIHTTAGWLGNLLYDSDDGYRYTCHSNIKVDFKCPNCKRKIPNKVIHKIYERGLSCPSCSDSLSYPEKFMFSILEQLNIDFETQSVFEWSKNVSHVIEELSGNKRYDFYIPSLNTIIETHGVQHYEQSARSRSLTLEQENDRLKENIAKENNIDHYIIIDCRKSELEWIKRSILKSELNEIFDLTVIDWLKVHEFTMTTIVKDICELWNKKEYTIKEMCEIMKVGMSFFNKCLKKGVQLGWCDYNPKETLATTRIALSKGNSKPVIQLSLDGKFIKEWRSVVSVKRELNFSAGNIASVCRGERNKANGFNWVYKDDYLNRITD